MLRSFLALTATTLLLAGCGGGGGGSPATAPPFGTSAQFAEPVAGCSVETQKQFVRAYLDEVYLWYREIPPVDASQYTTVSQVDDYFDALVNLPKDEFSQAVASGKHATVQSSSPAAWSAAGTLLASHAVPTAPVVTTTAGGRRVAYLQLKNHFEGAQDELITAFRQLQPQGVQDLILDLRDNTGGFVYVALSAASMIASPASNGQVFERLVFNDKRGQASLLFSGTVQFADGPNPLYPVGTVLPQLSLPRVFILTSNDPITGISTCSASESIINSLRGIGVQTIRIGETTCGKPYGFTEKVNCGYSFFAIEFQGFNAAGFGDYQAGFDPMCRIADNTRTAPATRGSATDQIYNAALFYADRNECPADTFTGVQSAASPIVSASSPRKRPLVGTRLLPPGLQPR